MDILKKCELISNNLLFSNQGIGNNEEFILEAYTEIKADIENKIEKLISPIIEEYKIRKKNDLLSCYDVDLEYEDNPDILDNITKKRKQLNKYVDVLNEINNRIKEIQQQSKLTTKIKITD